MSPLPNMVPISCFFWGMAVLLVSTPRIFQARAAKRNGCQKDAARPRSVTTSGEAAASSVAKVVERQAGRLSAILGSRPSRRPARRSRIRVGSRVCGASCSGNLEPAAPFRRWSSAELHVMQTRVLTPIVLTTTASLVAFWLGMWVAHGGSQAKVGPGGEEQGYYPSQICPGDLAGHARRAIDPGAR